MLKVPDKRTKALLDLADFMEKLKPEQYDQEHFLSESGARCICGWVNHNDGWIENDKWHAQQLLGLVGDKYADVACRLFSGNAGSKFSRLPWTGFHLRLDSPTPKDAAKCLRHLAVTDELPKDW